MIPIWIGWDSKEDIAYQVCKRSIERRASEPVHIRPIRQAALRYTGLYRRGSHINNGVLVDDVDGKPFSTEFAFTRFLVPALQQYEGWAVFCDCDFLFRSDIRELWEMRDDRYHVMVVQHSQIPKHDTKMDGQVQDHYYRKNWSSLMLINCEKVARLTPDLVNQWTGADLHAFHWVDDPITDIGALPHGWNWLEGNECQECAGLDRKNIKAVHFTRGGPWFKGCENVEFAAEWEEERRDLEWLRR